MKNILVIGGTGTVGSEVVKTLKKKNFNIMVLTHNEDHLKNLPSGVTGVMGDLSNKSTLFNALKDIDGVFLLNAVSENETQMGLNAVEAAKNAKVEQIVYLSIHNVDSFPEPPHFKSKIIIEKAIKESGITYTILRPNNFFQNDLWFVDAIKKYNTYPQPIGSIGLSRVDVRDIADAAANAFGNPDHFNKTYPIVGPDTLTGKETAKLIGNKIGQPINYSDDLNQWSHSAKEMMPDWMVKDLKMMYQLFQDKGLKASESDFMMQDKILGHEPRSYDEFLEEIYPTLKS